MPCTERLLHPFSLYMLYNHDYLHPFFFFPSRSKRHVCSYCDRKYSHSHSFHERCEEHDRPKWVRNAAKPPHVLSMAVHCLYVHNIDIRDISPLCSPEVRRNGRRSTSAVRYRLICLRHNFFPPAESLRYVDDLPSASLTI